MTLSSEKQSKGSTIIQVSWMLDLLELEVTNAA